MRAGKVIGLFLAVALLVTLMQGPLAKAEENPPGTVLRYMFTKGETRQYRYTMTIADESSYSAELVMDLTATVSRVTGNLADVTVTPQLVSFKAGTEKQQSAIGAGTAPRNGVEELMLQVVNDLFGEDLHLRVNAFGQVERPGTSFGSSWIEAIRSYPELFCPLYSTFEAGGPNLKLLPFLVNYSEEPANVGQPWKVPFDPRFSSEPLGFSWTLREVADGKAIVEQMPQQYRMYMSFGENVIELMTMYREIDAPLKPRNAPGPVVRDEKCSVGGTMTVDLATGWIVRYESKTHAAGNMQIKKPGLFGKKSETPIDSTMTTVLELR